MAFARLLFRVLLTLLILLAVIGLLLPSSARVERSILIDAPAAEIFPHLNGMRAFHAWSPWSDIDPETLYQFEGPEQGVGSRMTWESGNSRSGAAARRSSTACRTSGSRCSWRFGDKGNGNATFLLEPEGRGNAGPLAVQYRVRLGPVRPLCRPDARQHDRGVLRQGPQRP